jgi:hypothetical protein
MMCIQPNILPYIVCVVVEMSLNKLRNNSHMPHCADLMTIQNCELYVIWISFNPYPANAENRVNS